MGIRSRNIDRNSGVHKHIINWGHSVALNSATASAAEELYQVPRNGRVTGFTFGSRGLSTATSATGGLEIALHGGATTTAANLLSATARLDTGTTGTWNSGGLNTAIILGPLGGMVVSAGQFLLVDVNSSSATHSVGFVGGTIEIEWDT